VPDVHVDVVRDDAALAGLARPWAALLADTPAASGFQSLPWILACRSWLPADGRRLHTLVVRDGDDPIGILPAELGSRGDLRFVGDAVSNYAGPVHRADRLEDVAAALGDHLARDTAVRLVDLRGLREGAPFLVAWSAGRRAGFRAPGVVRTASAPWLDLSPGWKAIAARRSGTARGLVARKWRALTRLGRLEFVETEDPDGVRDALPAMFRLFRARWAGRHESGGFADRRRAFHERAAQALAADGRVRLSLLLLDGDPIAFAYGVRGTRGTVSYVLAHDDALASCSPGALLLARMLEAACARGDAEYDFSIGDEQYKTEWATGTRGVFRVVEARAGSAAVVGAVRAGAARAWTAMRSVDSLRDLRREGPVRVLLGAPSIEDRPDAPGMPAGAAGRWDVVRVEPVADASATTVAWTWDELRRALSPRLLAVAVDRNFRNDELVVLADAGCVVGIVWRASAARRAVVAGGTDVETAETVYYHPVAAPGRRVDDVVRALAAFDRGRPLLVVRRRDVGATIAAPLQGPLATFRADVRLKTMRGPRAIVAALAAIARGATPDVTGS
jgi:CelD/BcsL family acetyltransferase involved in cellulose biosynthesis